MLAWPAASVLLVGASKLTVPAPLLTFQLIVRPTIGAPLESFNSTTSGCVLCAPGKPLWLSPESEVMVGTPSAETKNCTYEGGELPNAAWTITWPGPV